MVCMMAWVFEPLIVGLSGLGTTTAAAAFVSGVTPTWGTGADAGRPGTTAKSRAVAPNASCAPVFSLKNVTPVPPETRMMNGPV